MFPSHASASLTTRSSSVASSSALSPIPGGLSVDSSLLGRANRMLSEDILSQSKTSDSFVVIPSLGSIENSTAHPIPSVIETVRYSRAERLIGNIPVLADKSDPNVLHHFTNLRYLSLENRSRLTALPPTLMGLNRTATLFLSVSGIDLLNPLGGRVSKYLPPPPPEWS